MLHRTAFPILRVGLLALFLSVSFFGSKVLAASESTIEHFRLGLGLGVSYGGTIGLNLEIMPINYLAISGAIGIDVSTIRHPVWNLGVRIYPLKKDGVINPRLSGYVGKLGDRIKDELRDPEIIVLRGYAFGPGIDFKFKTGLSTDFELLYLKSSGFERLEKNSEWYFSLGVGIPF